MNAKRLYQHLKEAEEKQQYYEKMLSTLKRLHVLYTQKGFNENKDQTEEIITTSAYKRSTTTLDQLEQQLEYSLKAMELEARIDATTQYLQHYTSAKENFNQKYKEKIKEFEENIDKSLDIAKRLTKLPEETKETLSKIISAFESNDFLGHDHVLSKLELFEMMNTIINQNNGN